MMSVRISIGKEKCYEVGEWCNEHFGKYEEGKTWFWSTEVTEIEKGNYDINEGIRIWSDNKNLILLAALKWGK